MNQTNNEMLKLALGGEAEDAIYRTMDAAESTGVHTPGSWVYEGRDHHLTHAMKHLMNVISGDITESSVDVEFDHLITRVMMAYWSQTAGILDDMGPEGVNRPRS